MLMVEEVQRQFTENPNLLVEGTTDRPDYKKCVEISTQASLREMIAPAALVILSPLITGTFFGIQAVYALLTGSLCSSVMLAISMSNTGGGSLLMIYLCNFHVLNNLLLIYICKLHWNRCLGQLQEVH